MTFNELAERSRGGGRGSRRVSVSRLCEDASGQGREDAHCYWVSWYERWVNVEKGRFTLKTASWTVFRGREGIPRKTQILRADWDQIGAGAGKADAGHPHWHVDQAMRINGPGVPVDGHGTLVEVGGGTHGF